MEFSGPVQGKAVVEPLADLEKTPKEATTPNKPINTTTEATSTLPKGMDVVNQC